MERAKFFDWALNTDFSAEEKLFKTLEKIKGVSNVVGESFFIEDVMWL